jgi:hypothetical protein
MKIISEFAFIDFISNAHNAMQKLHLKQTQKIAIIFVNMVQLGIMNLEEMLLLLMRN